MLQYASGQNLVSFFFSCVLQYASGQNLFFFSCVLQYASGQNLFFWIELQSGSLISVLNYCCCGTRLVRNFSLGLEF